MTSGVETREDLRSAAAWPAAASGIGASTAVWGVMVAFLVHGLVVSTWVSRIATMKSALHLGDGTLGLALLGAAIGSVTAIPICGSLVTRYGSRRIAIWTSAGFCCALAPLALAQSLTTLVAGLVLYGVMAGANDVAMNAQAVGTERLLGTPTMSRFHAMFSLGGIIGAGIGALLAGRGVAPAIHLIAGTAVCLALVAMLSRLLIETGSGTATGRSTEERLRVRRLPLALVALSAIGFCIFLSEGAIADWTAVYLKQILGANDGLAPVGYAVFSAAMAIFRFSGDAITLRFGRAWTIRLGGGIAAAGLAWVVIVHSPYWALAGFFAAGAGFSSIIPLVFAAGGRIPRVSEGAGVATVSGLGYLGFLAGPPAIGLISEITSLRAGLFLLVILSAVAVMLVSVVERQGGNALAAPLADESAGEG
jgi:MFS family permease